MTLIVFINVSTVFAIENADKKILFVPLDTRPINSTDTVMIADRAGFGVISPPEGILGTESRSGDTEKLWDWVESNAHFVDAAVISTDALLYGSLVDSRKHTLNDREVEKRLKRFEELKKNHPNLKIYAYGTILRTLLSNTTHSNAGMEPKIYQENAVKIYRYSALLDKSEMKIATKSEIKELDRLKTEIHKDVMQDWENRHGVNYNANIKLANYAKENIFSFFLLGGDDSSQFSATHREARMIGDYAKSNNIDRTKIQVLAGADELGCMMIARAALYINNEVPFVHIVYNDGKGKDILPTFSFDTVEDTMKSSILAIGAMEVPNPKNADFIFMINTDIGGKTFAANVNNRKKSNKSVKAFMKKLHTAIDNGYNAAVADISFANGSDNALMEAMRRENLQFKIKAYGGWNTATNTIGFLLGTSALTKFMTEKSVNELILSRYLDDWAYQANVRQELAAAFWTLPGKSDGAYLDEKQIPAEKFVTEKIQKFAEENILLPPNHSLKISSVALPWRRMFECKVNFAYF